MTDDPCPNEEVSGGLESISSNGAVSHLNPTAGHRISVETVSKLMTCFAGFHQSGDLESS